MARALPAASLSDLGLSGHTDRLHRHECLGSGIHGPRTTKRVDDRTLYDAAGPPVLVHPPAAEGTGLAQAAVALDRFLERRHRTLAFPLGGPVLAAPARSDASPSVERTIP